MSVEGSLANLRQQKVESPQVNILKSSIKNPNKNYLDDDPEESKNATLKAASVIGSGVK